MVNNEELYDLSTDHGETENVIAEHPEVVDSNSIHLGPFPSNKGGGGGRSQVRWGFEIQNLTADPYSEKSKREGTEQGFSHLA